jgi:hypothetical protein
MLHAPYLLYPLLNLRDMYAYRACSETVASRSPFPLFPGANIGLFGAEALSKAPNADVSYIAIEPIPLTVEALRLNLLGTDGCGKDSFFSLNATSSRSYSNVLASATVAETLAPGHEMGAVAGGSAEAEAALAKTTAALPLAAAGQAGGGAAGSQDAAAEAQVLSAAVTLVVSQRVSAPYPGNITIIPTAVSDTAKPAAQMTFYPYMPGNSTLRTQEKEMLQQEVGGKGGGGARPRGPNQEGLWGQSMRSLQGCSQPELRMSWSCVWPGHDLRLKAKEETAR